MSTKNTQPGPHLKLRDMLSLSLRVFRVRPVRTLLTIMGISLGIGAVLFLVSLGYGLQNILLGELASTEDSLRSVEVYYPTESDLLVKQSDIERIGIIPEQTEVSPVAESSGEVRQGMYSGFMLFRMVEPSFFRLSGVAPDTGKAFTDTDNGVVISSSALKLLNIADDQTAIGKPVSLHIFYQTAVDTSVEIVTIPDNLVITGVVSDPSASPYIYIPAKYLQGREVAYRQVFVKARTLDEVGVLSDRLINEGFVISARIELVNQARKAMQVITIILGVFGATALVVSAIGMFNTMLISFLERVFEIGIMKSLGATSENIRNLILTESFVVGILGGIGGVIAGMVSGEGINFALNWFISRYGASPIDLFIYPPQFILIIIILSGIVGISAGLWPAYKAVQLSPKDAFLRQ